MNYSYAQPSQIVNYNKNYSQRNIYLKKKKNI